MVKAGQHARLAAEPLGKSRVGGEGFGQHLQGDPTFQLGLARLVDRAHAAGPDQFHYLQLRERGGHR